MIKWNGLSDSYRQTLKCGKIGEEKTVFILNSIIFRYGGQYLQVPLRHSYHPRLTIIGIARTMAREVPLPPKAGNE